jgi:hypothetical protein
MSRVQKVSVRRLSHRRMFICHQLLGRRITKMSITLICRIGVMRGRRWVVEMTRGRFMIGWGSGISSRGRFRLRRSRRWATFMWRMGLIVTIQMAKAPKLIPGASNQPTISTRVISRTHHWPNSQEANWSASTSRPTSLKKVTTSNHSNRDSTTTPVLTGRHCTQYKNRNNWSSSTSTKRLTGCAKRFTTCLYKKTIIVTRINKWLKVI